MPKGIPIVKKSAERRYKTCNVTLEPEGKELIDALAERNDLKRSQAVRRILNYVMKNKSILARLFPKA